MELMTYKTTRQKPKTKHEIRKFES